MQFKLAFFTACISLLSAGTQAAAAAVEVRLIVFTIVKLSSLNPT